MFGCFTSILFRREPKDVTAIAIETGVQNTGIAIMLLKLSFPGDEGSKGMLLPIIAACFTPIPLLLGYGVHTITKSFRRNNQTREEAMFLHGKKRSNRGTLSPSVSFQINSNHISELQTLTLPNDIENFIKNVSVDR